MVGNSVMNELIMVKLRVFVFPGPRPFAWPPALAPGPSPQFVFTGPGPQLVFIGPGPHLRFVFTSPGQDFTTSTATTNTIYYY